MGKFTVINSPNEITVPASQLSTAIASAPAGTVINVTKGSPISLTVSRFIDGYGLIVNLPSDQVIHAVFNTGAGGVHFFGGIFSADTVLGTTVQTNNGARLLNANSKISVHGSVLDGNQNGFLANVASDIWLRNVINNVARADAFNFITGTRVKIEGCVTKAGGKGSKICYFGDGREPLLDVGQSACSAAGGQWEDTSHVDGFQGRDECTDVTIINNEFAGWLGQGITSFGTGDNDSTGNRIVRALVANNTVRDASSWGVWLAGADIEVRDNTCLQGDGGVLVRLQVHRQGSGRVRGGRNSAPSIVNPSGVDLGGGTINGDAGVVAPENPRITLAPWAPAVPVPVAPVETVPTYVSGGGIRWVGYNTTTPTADDWLTINRGIFKGTSDATWEYRWRVNGILVAGVDIPVLQAVSGVITAEVRGVSAKHGAGEWHAYPSITIA